MSSERIIEFTKYNKQLKRIIPYNVDKGDWEYIKSFFESSAELAEIDFNKLCDMLEQEQEITLVLKNDEGNELTISLREFVIECAETFGLYERTIYFDPDDPEPKFNIIHC